MLYLSPELKLYKHLDMKADMIEIRLTFNYDLRRWSNTTAYRYGS